MLEEVKVGVGVFIGYLCLIEDIFIVGDFVCLYSIIVVIGKLFVV